MSPIFPADESVCILHGEAQFLASSINLPWPPTAHLLLPISCFCWARFNTSTLSSYHRAREIIGPLSASPQRQASRARRACCVLCLCRECLAQCPAHLSKALPSIHLSSGSSALGSCYRFSFNFALCLSNKWQLIRNNWSISLPSQFPQQTLDFHCSWRIVSLNATPGLSIDQNGAIYDNKCVSG